MDEENKKNLKKKINKLLENNIIKEWFSAEDITKDDSLLECIYKCKSPRISKEDKDISIDDLKLIFNAFSLFEPEETKVLIIGQDPYPDNDEYRILRYGKRAHGLAFSFLNSKKDENKSEPAADSLINIFKAIDKYKSTNEISDIYTWNTNLEHWAKKNKVLLLNTALTHANKKSIKHHIEIWEDFILKIMNKLLKRKNNKLTIFLWGAPAQKTFLKCLNKYDDLSFVSKKIKKIDNGKYVKNGEFIVDKSFKVICIENAIKIFDSDNKEEILVFMTNHPSRLSENSKGMFVKYSQNHFQACDEFIGEINGKYIWKDFPENNK